MKKRWSLLWTVILFLMLPFSLLHAEELRFICNKDVTEKVLSTELIKNIFLGNIVKWSDGKNITFVVNYKEKEIHSILVRNYTNKAPSQFKNYWKRKMFAGEGSMPKNFKTQDDVIKFISQTSGAIGYIGKSTTVTANVKTINVK